MLQPRMESAVWHSCYLRPFNQRFRFAIERDSCVGSPVPALLRFGCPNAIKWFVVSVVVFALNAHPCWRVSHVGEKVFKFLPTCAHGNAATTIIRETGISRVAASLFHSMPDAEGARMRQAVSNSRLPSRFGVAGVLQASARLRAPQDEALRYNHNVLAAVTRAVPHVFAANVCSDIVSHGKPAKTLSGQISEIAHSLFITSNPVTFNIIDTC